MAALTVTIEKGHFEAYQHLSVGVAARTLEHRPHTVETNRQTAIQIEIVAYARNAPVFSNAYLDGIARLMRWIEGSAGVARATTVLFVHPGSEARLSDERWLAYTGWCGHQHVPHNSHEDPGAIKHRPLTGVIPSHNERSIKEAKK